MNRTYHRASGAAESRCCAEHIRYLLWRTLFWLVLLVRLEEPSDILIGIIVAPIFATPLFVIAGFVFGILGLDTEGQHHAITGLVLSSLTALLTFPALAFMAFMAFLYSIPSGYIEGVGCC